jgi:hypothetical protein
MSESAGKKKRERPRYRARKSKKKGGRQAEA